MSPDPALREDPGRPREEGTPDQRIRWGRALLAFALVPLGTGAVWALQRHPDWVERVYCARVFPAVVAGQRALFGWWPGSAAEVLLGLALAWLGWTALRGVRAVLRRRVRPGRALGFGLARGLTWAGLLYGLFLVCWGLHHARRPYAHHAGLELELSNAGELRDLCWDLVQECNRLAPEVAREDLALAPGTGTGDPRLVEGYARLARRVPALDGRPPLVRVPLASPLLSRLGISGIYSPYTGEAHVNGEQPVYAHPFTAAHEVAHQRGFAREDECNFIAWQVCRASGDRAFAYSASLVSLNLALNALSREDLEGARLLFGLLSDEVRADRDEARRFWDSKRSAVTDVAERTNDTYLKSQGQAAGTESYGRMVDLLLAERRAVGAGWPAPVSPPR